MINRSIKAKLYIVIAFITMILLLAVLNYFLNGIVRSSDYKSQKVIRLEKKFSDIIFDERTSAQSSSKHETLKKEYTGFRKALSDLLPEAEDNLVSDRLHYLNELFQINKKSSDLYREVRRRLMELFGSVKYIHEHHIGYLKNLMRRGTIIQDYERNESFERSPFKSAHELDIIKMAISVQNSLFNIFQSFHALQHEVGPSTVEKEFSNKIKAFYTYVNTFEDYSLDAQDGLLVEELLFNGRTFEDSFKDLVTIETRKLAIIENLEENRDKLLKNIGISIQNIKSKNESIKRNIESLEIISLISTLFIIIWIINEGRRIINEIKRTVTETEKIQEDFSYQIQIDNNVVDEFRIVSQALNLMTKKINDHVAELEKSNEDLRVEISERKRAEKMAENANQAKSDFLANMSHELRTPLNHILGFTELVVDKHFGDLNDTQEEYLNDVLYSGNHLLSLINDILDLSKVEAGKLQMEPTRVDLKMLLENSLIMFKEKAMQHHLKLTTAFENIPRTIQADERKLKQIIYNLLSNAVKFTPNGGKIKLHAKKMDYFKQNKNTPAVEISIADSGIGIKSEDIARIFKPFEQAEGSSSRNYQGTGLGLSLTKHLVEMHDGKIWVKSGGEGNGSTFHFILPA